MIRTVHQGIIYIQAWEFVLIPVYLFIIFLIASRIKNSKIKSEPVYKYYLLGLYAKIFGGFLFAMVYIYVYHGGDTMTYFETSLAMCNMFFKDPLVFFRVLLGPNSPDLYYKFDGHTGYMVGYVFKESKAFMVARLTTPLALISFKSYILTTILVSWVTYSGLWRLYLMFVRYFPALQFRIALATLFIPSIIFWGSGIMKDSYTMAATGWYVYYIDHVFVRKKYHLKGWLFLLLSAAVLISLKPYIFMVLFPGTLYWAFNARAKQIKNKLIMYMLLPAIYIALIFGSLFILESMGEYLGKFSLENALNTAVASSRDLKADYYKGSVVDIGDFEPTVEGALSKFIPATVAGLFRPYITESNNAGMLMSGIENTFLVFILIYSLMKTRVKFFFINMFKEPLIMFCLLFSVIFAFVIGLTTSNFGALVRFKIPLLPFFISALFIQIHLYDQKRNKRRSGIG